MKNITHAIRVLLKNKFYSFLNIIGLSIGLSASIIIMLYVQSDLAFDKYHERWENIYRVESKYNVNGQEDEYALTSRLLAELLQSTYPEIQSYVRFQSAGRRLIRIKDHQFYVEDLYFADSTTFDVFTHEFIHGNPKTALDQPRSIVLTETLSSRIFGEANPINEVIRMDIGTFQVTGVIKDLPENLHLRYGGLISLTTLTSGQPTPTPEERSNQLWGISLYTYVTLPKDYDLTRVYEKFPEFFEEYMAPAQQGNGGGETTYDIRLVNLADVHFGSKVQYDRPSGNKIYTLSFTAIGIFILALACINYINLATARASSRSREIGVRKVLGSTKAKLKSQFLGESLIITVFSLLLACLISFVLIEATPLNSLLEKDLKLDFFNNNLLLYGSLGITLIIGLLSGVYPALYLSSISVLVAMKGVVSSGPRSLFLRKVLVVFQFFVSIAVVIITLLMQKQIEFINNKDLGFSKDNMVLVPIQDTVVSNRIDFIRSELMQNPSVLGVTDFLRIGGSTSVGNNLLGAGRRFLEIEQEQDSSRIQDIYNVLMVGEDYLSTLNMELVKGRDFDEKIPSDIIQSVLVNEAMVEAMGWEDPLNKVVSFAGAPTPSRVIGVVKDFHAFSLHLRVEPTMISRYDPNNPQFGRPNTFIIHLAPNNLGASIDYLENRFRELDPGHPFEYQFIDKQSEQLYDSDQRQSRLTSILSYICIIISCLGLLGLASFTTSTRIKEIGLRKVLGATVTQLVLMIFKDIMVLVVIGFVIATPVAYLAIRNWLEVFQYRMPLQTVILFAATASILISLVVAFLTVSYHSFNAARQNPVKALRNE